MQEEVDEYEQRPKKRLYRPAVHHTLAYFMTVVTSFSHSLHASHYYNVAIYSFYFVCDANPPFHVFQSVKDSFFSSKPNLCILFHHLLRLLVQTVTAHLFPSLLGSFVNTSLPQTSLLANLPP